MIVEKEWNKEEGIYIETFYKIENGIKGNVIAIKCLNEKGELHRENHPAFFYFYDDGNIIQHRYFRDGDRHREDGPASISYYHNGEVWKEEYWENDKLIRCFEYEIKNLK